MRNALLPFVAASRCYCDANAADKGSSGKELLAPSSSLGAVCSHKTILRGCAMSLSLPNFGWGVAEVKWFASSDGGFGLFLSVGEGQFGFQCEGFMALWC